MTGLAMWWLADEGTMAGTGTGFKPITIAALIVAGLVLDLAALTLFLRAGTTVNPLRPEATSTLVVTGVYRLTRNPMYLGLTCLLAAWGLYLSSMVALVGIPVFMMLVTQFQIRPEEQALEACYGEAFRRYRSRTRRWL
jgi:protein-S-isoprenylcysteine O-methyltransferase Ste14